MTTWVTFAPCFAWIFLGAPYMEGMRSNKALSAALSTVTAAVVGVVLNLAIWFALHVIFGELRPFELGPIDFDLPVGASINLRAAALSAMALIATFRLEIGMTTVLGGAAAAGILIYLAGSF